MAVNISGLSRAAVLAALYNASRPLGMGFLQYDPNPMTEEEAEAILKVQTSFDYLKGRVMKLELRQDDSFEERLYDRDNSAGAAQRAIDALRNSGNANAAEHALAHDCGTQASAIEARKGIQQGTKFANGVLTLGMGDVKEVLAPKVDRAVAGVTSKQN